VIDTGASGETEITPYVDGHAVSYTKLSSGTGAGSFAESTLFWMSRDASTLFGAGSMQDLALYDTTLSASTILDHYAYGEHGPQAAFTSSPVVATAGVPVHFGASATESPDGVSDYAWDFDGSKTYATDGGSSPVISHTFTSPGTYTVDLQVEDALGQKGTVSRTVTVGAALGEYEQAVEKASDISHFWPMGEASGSSFTDVIGGANAASSGGVSLGEPGGLVEDSSTAAAFDGSSGAARAPIDLSGTHELTIEFWMKWHAYGADDRLAMEFTPNFNSYTGGFLVDPDATPGSDFAVAVGKGGTANTAFFTRPSAEQWHYYTFVIDTEASGETEITPYVDGKAVSYTKGSSNTGAGAFANSTLYWMSRNATELFGAGSMQDLALYEGDLSPEAILEHYALGEHGPKAAFTSSPAVATAGVPVHFDASGSTSPTGPVSDYAWDFDGSKSYASDGGSTATISHTFTSPGTYTVDLQVEDSLGEKATVSKTITVGAALGEYEQAVEGTSGIAHFWPMSEASGSTFADAVGGADATTSGGTTLGEPGGLVEDLSTSAAFNGTSGAAQANVDLSGTSKLTVEFWMKWHAYGPDDKLALELTPNFNEHPGGFLVDPDATPGSDFAVAVGQSSAGHNNNVLFERPSAEQWHYYAFVIDTEASGETEITPYVDGHAVSYTKLSSDTGAGHFAYSTLYWMSRDASSLFGAGSMQDLALYESDLNSETVLEHYERGEDTYSVVNTTAPSIEGTAEDGQTLTANHGSWTGAEPITYAYQWQRCNSSGGSCSNISGATSSTYVPGHGDVGATLRVVVMGNNAGSSASATSELTGIVSPAEAPLVYSGQFGSGGSGADEFSHPGDVAVDGSGNLWVLDYGNDRVEEFNAAGEYLRGFGSAGSGAGELSGPDGLAIDSKGDIWVADTGNERVEEFNDEGEFLRTVGVGLVGVAEGIAVDQDEDVWVSGTSAGQLVVFNKSGEYLKTVGSRGSGAGEMGEPEGLAVDSHGDIWVADWSDNRVEEFNESGEYVKEFGSHGSGEGQISHPYGIAVEPSGYVWVGEVGNDRLQEFGEEGEYMSALGVEGSEAERFSLSYPVGLAIDSGGDLWITDPGKNRIAEWVPNTPSAPSNTAAPKVTGEALEGGTLTASKGTWAGRPSPTYSYQWQRCNEGGGECASITGATTLTYTLGSSDVGKTIRMLVTVSNSAGSASAASSATSIVSVGPPANVGAPVISGLAKEGQTLTAREGEWEGTPPITYTYQWQSCDGLGESCMDIAGATGASYELQASDVGATLRVLVTAEDAGGSATAISLPSPVAEGNAPVSLAAPVISGTAQDGQTLTASDGEWAGTPSFEYTYQWEHCNATGGECEEIADATSSTYTLQDGDVRGSVRVLVTARNAVGSASADSAASSHVAPVAPVNSSLPSISGTSVEGETLTASPGVWSGSPAPSYVFRWERCNSAGEACSEIEGATGTTYLLGAVDVGHTLRVRVVATNAATSATASSSATATVESTGAVVPANTALPAISGSPKDGQTLSASVGSWEGTSLISYTYQWQSCNEAGSDCEAIEGATDPTYRLDPTDEQTTLRVLVTASGPGGRAQAVSEASATVQAGAPSELEAPSISGSPSAGEALYAETGAWGGSGVQFSYQWERCNEAGAECRQIPGAGEAEYIPGEGDASSTLRVRVGASNALGSLTALSPVSTLVQPAGVLLNTAAPTVSGEPVSGGTLSADPGGWLGSDVISYAYEWQRCDLYGGECEDIEGAGASTYNPVVADVGHTLRVRVGASELEGAASEISSTTAPVAASGAPVAEGSPSIAGTGLVGYTLIATAGAWSGEAGEIGYSYQWERCGEISEACSAITGATEDSYTLTEADAGSVIRVLVSASDLGGSSEAASAPIIASAKGIANAAQSSVSGGDQLGRPLQANAGIWTGSGAIAFAYEWQRCNEEGESCTAISGATGSAYSPVEADSGHTLRVKVTATGLEGAVSETSPATPPIGSEATTPENTAVPSIEGNLTKGDALKANTGSWSGSEPITYTYHWQRCNLLDAACVEIEGATSDTYTLTEADIGTRIQVLVNATNSAGSESATSEASEEVGAIGAPANTQEPVTTGRAVEGQRLFVENGRWSGSKPFTYYYRWERCNTAGESCVTITGANRPSYTLVSADVGATVRVNVTAANGLDSAGSVSPHTDVVVTAAQAGISAAREAVEGADPSLLARSTSATIEEQSLTPAITDSGEEISSQSTLASSTISKATPGEFSLETSAGQISLTPLKPSLSADAMPTIANGTAALFAETWHESDTLVRPSALGAIALLQLRSEHAPTSESWEVNLGTSQQLEQLPDGSVAIIEPTPEASLESPPGEEGPALGSSEASAHEEGEGFDRDKSEEELNSSLGEESALGPLSAAPTISVTEPSPKEHELHPQDTKEHYEHDKSAMSYAEEHTSDTALMVIEAPTVIDAAGHTVPATLAVEGDTITLAVSPEPEASYPITAEIATAAPTDLVSVARDPVKYGLSDPKASVFENLNADLTKAPLNIKVVRDVIPYYAWQTAPYREELLAWLKAVGKHKYLKPYITLEALNHKTVSYSEYKADVSELMKELINGKETEGIPPVKLWGAWNEPDIENILADNAPKAAVMWKIADAIGGELHCGCKIAAGEFYEFDGYINKYINTILHDPSYGTAKPSDWGLHDYYDLENLQRHTEEHKGNVDLEKFLKEIKGTPKIWISETGVVLQNGGEATKLETGAKYAKLQVAAANDVLNLAKGHSRVELVDYYLYEGPTSKYEKESNKPHAFDSALVAGTGITETQKPREAYCVLVLNKKKGCPAGGITKGPRGRA
jgi:PKD domain/Concanavalin A-like lectin/glucanases superfamily/NHL repeat